MERMKSVLVRPGSRGGFVAAHIVNKDPRGHDALAEVDARITEFTDRIGEAYRAQEAKIDGIAAGCRRERRRRKDAPTDPTVPPPTPPTARRARTPVLCRGTHR
jgi:hypothetical protein